MRGAVKGPSGGGEGRGGTVRHAIAAVSTQCIHIGCVRVTSAWIYMQIGTREGRRGEGWRQGRRGGGEGRGTEGGAERYPETGMENLSHYVPSRSRWRQMVAVRGNF